ncbi:ribulose-5-phosphate 4-epimerase/fuculose-1-phosphate aldolase [Advenella incenata]|jgi:ribulose-5-phosphate 4-epimerase/fuculose-1-phosphate aldolase|uniref:Ribulose-5-phosphate 4-epimerase/fuculose-1-phosphate aldolase n=1 Tax=Advenella incenata TaxID=267800 RepID=A0A4Q7V6S3_9BURK|nr:class II aldolase/adducin family protein [Advenella incenata]RZT91554.1 ribulose-5-phosphate 4-epimerase/fuculose-1-phosphate aldolase [Advenella incenata]
MKYSNTEWEARVDLAACYRLMPLFGMSDLVYNHITARIPGTDDEILINPYGYMYEEITASSLIKINIKGEVLDNPHADGTSINQAGYVIHSAVHASRHDVGCVIHTHSRAGMAVSAMECGLLPITQTSMRFKDIAYHDYESVAIDMDEQQRLVADLGHQDAMILRNHGLLVASPSIAEAFNAMYWLEMACRAQVDALAGNTKLIIPSAEVVEKTHHLYQPSVRRPFGIMEWPAMRRYLDRRDASYKD